MKPEFDTIIVGAGFSGIIAALRLKANQRESFVILERATDVGGTWRDNTYPGCACDVPSNLYSISNVPNPDWTRVYPSQPEILAYLQRVVRDHGLLPRIRFGFEVQRMEFREDGGFWIITDREGQSVSGRSVIAGLGPFSRPRLPDIQGLGTFQGETLHSARWDPSVDLKGKRVGVIGTGASAVQIVPSIAPEVTHLTVFQRSAAWVGDRMDAEVSEAVRLRNRRQPWRQFLNRMALYWFMEFRGRLFTGDKRVRRYFKNLSLKKLEREVKDPELRKKLTPTYEYGCKRILSSDDYWPTFNRPNVSLETDPIVEITSNGIRTVTGTEHPLDVIIFATGFEVAEITHDLKIYGRGGRELYAEWRERGLEAFKGSSVSGYPNLNFMLGPNSGLGHNSMIAIMEAQMNYVMSYLDLLDRSGAAYLDLKPEVQRNYNTTIQQQFTGTVWASGCGSWYLNSHGKNTTLFPRLVEAFRRLTLAVRPNDYEQVKLGESGQ